MSLFNDADLPELSRSVPYIMIVPSLLGHNYVAPSARAVCWYHMLSIRYRALDQVSLLSPSGDTDTSDPRAHLTRCHSREHFTVPVGRLADSHSVAELLRISSFL
jgi:hypothetical protein